MPRAALWTFDTAFAAEGLPQKVGDQTDRRKDLAIELYVIHDN